MKKPATKSNKKIRGKDKYTVTEVGTLIDQFRGEFKVFGENIISVKSDVKSIKEMVSDNTERITLLEITVRNVVAKIDELIKSINTLVKTKADRQEFQALEKRVSILETKVASLSQ